VPDPLDDFERTEFTHDGKTRTVYRQGRGPAVIVLSEMPGITPRVADFARRLVGEGYTAVMPHLFGEPGKEPTMGYAMRSMGPACVSREFSALATRQTRPVTVWLRALARSEHERCGGPGVGVVGMCFTGGFGLAMAVDDSVLAPVLSQPSVPFPFGKERKRDLGLSDDDLAVVKKRAADDDLCVMGLRFTGDKMSPPERFQRLHEELGDNFVGVEIDSSPGNPHGNPKMAHSVLTEHLVDEVGHPTRDALGQVLELFSSRLLVKQ